MIEITYSDFQTLIEKQSDNKYIIVREDKGNPNGSDILQQICNIMYDKSIPIIFAVDDTSKPSVIYITICKGNTSIKQDLKIIYRDIFP